MDCLFHLEAMKLLEKEEKNKKRNRDEFNLIQYGKQLINFLANTTELTAEQFLQIELMVPEIEQDEFVRFLDTLNRTNIDFALDYHKNTKLGRKLKQILNK